MVGAVMSSFDSQLSTTMMIGAFLLGAVHWIGSVIDVCNNESLKKDSQTWYFWFAIIIMVPPISGMMYYMADKKKFII